MEINFNEFYNLISESTLSASTPQSFVDKLNEEVAKSGLEVSQMIKFREKENYNSDEYFDPKPGEYAPKGSLWNNPAVNKMRKTLTEDQLEYFNNQAHMYDYDFVNADIDADLKEITEYVIHGLKSGLHPRDMTEEEKDAMCEIYGPTFYLQYGFTEEDVYGDD